MIRGTKHEVVDTSVKMSIHNRFDIQIENVETGEIREAFAENVVLDRYWESMADSTSEYAPFNYIAIGSGTTQPSPSDTKLTDNWVLKEGVSRDWTRSRQKNALIRTVTSVLRPQDRNDKLITEVGMTPYYTFSTVMTRALIKDMNGNPISILKTNTDRITIIASIYLHVNYDLPQWIIPYTFGSVFTDPKLNKGRYLTPITGGDNHLSSYGDMFYLNTAYKLLARKNSSIIPIEWWNDGLITHILPFSGSFSNEPPLDVSLFGIDSTKLPPTQITDEVVERVNDVDFILSFGRFSDLEVFIDGVLVTDYTTSQRYARNTICAGVINYLGDPVPMMYRPNVNNNRNIRVDSIIYPNCPIGCVLLPEITDYIVTGVKWNGRYDIYEGDDPDNFTGDPIYSGIVKVGVELTITKKYILFTSENTDYNAIQIGPKNNPDHNIRFNEPIPEGSLVTANYKTTNLAKDANHIYKLNFEVGYD